MLSGFLVIPLYRNKAGYSDSYRSGGYKKAVLNWNRLTGADGYVLYMATSKTGKYTRIATLKGNGSARYTKSNLTKSRTYYFKVQAYSTVGSTNVYGSFSSVKSVKIK